MASVVVNGDTSGAVTLSAPAVAGTVTVTLPATSGTMAVLPTATGVLAESAGGTGTTTGYYGFKNRIINGAMVIDQRNAGASVTVNSASNTFGVDRWKGQASGGGVYTQQRSTTVPAGFTNSVLLTVTTADSSIASTDYYIWGQAVEGYNAADLGWGTVNAQTVTLSFWVRSSVTGTYALFVGNNGDTRSLVATYTILAANTFEQKTVTIAGDTSGTWATDNNIGIGLWFTLGAGSSFNATANVWNSSLEMNTSGSTQWIATNGATFYITGVQLEKGSTATSFDYRPYTTELQLCQRYYQLAGMGGSFLNSTASQQGRFMGTPCVTPRTSPTFTLVSSNVVGNVAAANPTSYNSGATTHLQVQSSAGSGAYTDANYTYSLSAEL